MNSIPPFFTMPPELQQTIARKLPVEDIRSLRTVCSTANENLEPIMISMENLRLMVSELFPEDSVDREADIESICTDLIELRKELSLSPSFDDREAITSWRNNLLADIRSTSQNKLLFFMAYSNEGFSDISIKKQAMENLLLKIKFTMVCQAALAAELKIELGPLDKQDVNNLPADTILDLCKKHLPRDFSTWGDPMLPALSSSNDSPFVDLNQAHNPLLYIEKCEQIAAGVSSNPNFMQHVMQERHNSDYPEVVALLMKKGINATVFTNKMAMNIVHSATQYVEERCTIS